MAIKFQLAGNAALYELLHSSIFGYDTMYYGCVHMTLEDTSLYILKIYRLYLEDSAAVHHEQIRSLLVYFWSKSHYRIVGMRRYTSRGPEFPIAKWVKVIT